MQKYDIDYLKDKGFFENENTEETSLEVEGKTYSYKIDFGTHIIAYFENVEELRPIVKKLKAEKEIDYVWFWNDSWGNQESERVSVYRALGDRKDFIYNLDYAQRREDYRKSKRQKLERFNKKSPDELFDTKDVVDKFYRDLWGERVKLAKSIQTDIPDDKKILAAQKIIDRLSFIYMLGEKDALGVEYRGTREWIRPKDYFSDLVESHNTRTYEALIEIFEAFNKEGTSKINIIEGQAQLIVPFLNGGLFRFQKYSGDKIDETDLQIEGYDWEDLIIILNSYNWQVKDIPEEENLEDGTFQTLTPEVLGHIYEKFIITVEKLDEITIEYLESVEIGEGGKIEDKGNKKVGAYYTPEDITQKIVENTLLKHLNDKTGVKAESLKSVKSEKNKSQIESTLEDIKILDSSVGSGHFLMAAGEHLADWRTDPNENGNDYEIKKEIILNNLYGVDIMEGAVEICRLRLWLWLIASAETSLNAENLGLEPLPNIDFNIRQGNSLIGYVEKETLKSGENYNIEEFKSKSMDEMFEHRQSLIKKYQDSSEEDKAKKLKDKIQNITAEYNDKLDEKIYKDLKRKGVTVKKDIKNNSDLNPDKAVEVKINFNDSLDNKPIDDLKKGIKINSGQNGYTSISIKEDYFKTNEEEKICSITDQVGWQNIEKIELERRVRREDIDDIGHFHWIMEFSDVFADGGFDITVGNPPYGHLLSAEEKAFLSRYTTGDLKEIAAQFVERQLDLLKDEGYFGNVTTTALVNHRSMKSVHELIENRLEDAKIASFARRPGKIFRNAEINVAIISGKNVEESSTPLKTSDFIRFNSSDRRERVQNITYSKADGLILRDKIGGAGDKEVIPKLGCEIKRSIISQIGENQDKMGDWMDGEHKLMVRKAANYFMNATKKDLENFTGSRAIKYDSDLKRDFAHLAMNSSLFYVYWLTYGDLHHVTKWQLKAFPVPEKSDLEENSQRIEKLSSKLQEEIEDNYNPDPENYQKMKMRPVKDTIDKIDEFLGGLYNLKDEQVKFLQKYHSEYGRTNSS